MNKISSLLVISMLALATNFAFAETVTNANNYDSAAKEYDFENNSYNISDEQLQKEAETDVLQQDKKVSFWSKIVNSSHFSSNTATKTWIPVNKAE